MVNPPGPGQPPSQYPYGPASPPSHPLPPAAGGAVPGAGLRIGLGLPPLLIALAAAAAAYALPSLRTFQMSMESGGMLGGDAEPVGLDNYRRLLTDSSFADGLLALAPPVLGTVVSGAVIAPLVAWAVHLSGSGVRMAARVVFGLAAIAFAPAAMVVAWVLDRSGSSEPWTETAGLIDWFQLLSGVVFGLGVLVALAAFRGGTDTGKRAAAVVTAAALTAFALVAAGLQTFTFNYVTGVPAPDGTPLQQVFTQGFRNLDTGVAAAGSVLLLGALAVLGIGAAVLFAAAKTRIDVGPGAGDPRRFAPGPGIVSVLLLIAFAAGVGLSLWPWLSRMTGESPTESDSSAVLLDTWGSAGAATAVAVAAALAGGYALGALRPLGDGSPWLLLLFAPWLFVGSGPLAVANYESLTDSEAVGTFMGLAPRAWVAIPALFVFTALFRGLEDRRREAVSSGARPGSVLAAAWPMVALVAMAVWLVNAQDVIWQIVSTTQDRPSASLVLFQGAFGYAFSADGIGVGVGYPIAMLAVFALAAAAAAVFYLPKVGIRVGRDRRAAQDPTMPLSMPRS